MFGGLGNLGALIKQAQMMGSRMEQLSDDLKQRRAKGSAGAGLVEIEVNGLQEVLACRIDPSLLVPEKRELVEDLVRTAVNDAVQQARQLHMEGMKSLTGNLDLPGLDEAMSKFMGGPPA